MMQISLSKLFAMIDRRRGKLLEEREQAQREVREGLCSPSRPLVIKGKLHELNELKEEIALVSDADQLPLGL